MTFDEFLLFAARYDYITKRGRQATGLTVDRIKEGKRPGYCLSNLQAITNIENITKEHKRRRDRFVYEKIHGKFRGAEEPF